MSPIETAPQQSAISVVSDSALTPSSNGYAICHRIAFLNAGGMSKRDALKQVSLETGKGVPTLSQVWNLRRFYAV